MSIRNVKQCVYTASNANSQCKLRPVFRVKTQRNRHMNESCHSHDMQVSNCDVHVLSCCLSSYVVHVMCVKCVTFVLSLSHTRLCYHSVCHVCALTQSYALCYHSVIRLTTTGLFVTYNQSLEEAPGSLSLRAQQVRVEIPKRQLATEMIGCCYCSWLGRSATHCDTYCNTLQHILQHTATHTATHCNTYCNTLQHIPAGT